MRRLCIVLFIILFGFSLQAQESAPGELQNENGTSAGEEAEATNNGRATDSADGEDSGQTSGGGSGDGADSPGSDGESGFFDESEFEKTVEKSTQKEEEKPKPIKFGGNFSFTNRIFTGIGFDDYFTEGRFDGKTYVEVRSPDHGAVYISYLFDLPVYLGTNDTRYQTLVPDSTDTFYGPAEFFLDLDIAKTVFFRAGKQIVSWGATRVWRPVDFINLKRRNNLETFDLRNGKPGLKVHVPISTTSIFGFIDFSETFRETLMGNINVSKFIDSTSYAVRFATVLGGFQLGLTAFAGPPLANVYGQYGLDLTTNILGIDIFTETAVYAGSETLDPAVSVSLGFEQSFGDLDRWALSGEGFFQSDGHTDESEYPLPISSDYVPFYLGRWYGYASLSRSEVFSQYIDMSLSGYVNFSDLSYRAILGTDFSFPGILPFSFKILHSGGGEGKEFTPYKDYTLEAALEVFFEF